MSGPDGGATDHRRREPEKPPRGLEIQTPPHWWDLPLDPSSRHEDLVALVDRRAGPALSPAMREELVATLEQAAAVAVAAGAVIASQVGVVGPGLAFGASVIVAVDAVDSTDLSALDRYVAELSAGPEAVERDVEVVRVELAAGPAVRRRAIRTYVGLDEGEGSPEELTVQYFLPIPGTRSTAVVACGSPETGAVEDLTDLFEGIADTLRFVSADEVPGS